MAIKRTKYAINIPPDAILTSDWHIRETTPECRLDNFEQTMWEKIDFVAKLQKQFRCPVLHAGDLFDHWKPSPYLISKTIERLPKQFITVYGNHDLPQHSMQLYDKSGVYTVAKGQGLEILPFGYWNDTPEKDKYLPIKTKKVYIWHKYVFKNKNIHIKGDFAHKLLKQYPQYDLILTGDNHTPFVEEYENRLLVNPGSLTRQTAAQIDFKPRVYLWYAKQNKVTPIYIPIKQGVITRQHLEKEQQRDKRIDKFINSLDGSFETSIDFKANLKAFEQTNQVDKNIMQIIYKAIDDHV